MFAAFRDRLLSAATLEDAYLSLVTDPSPKVPPLLLDHLVHAILRGVLDGCGDPFRLRAAECLFRAQRVTLADGAVLLGDEEMVEALAGGGAAELDVLREEDAAGYFARSDRFDTVLDVSFTRPGLDGLCRALEAWVRHFLGVEVQDPAAAGGERRALGLAHRAGRGVLGPAQRPLRGAGPRRGAAGAAAGLVPAGLPRPGRRPTRDGGRPGLPRHGEGSARPAEAEAAEPAGEPAAGGELRAGTRGPTRVARQPLLISASTSSQFTRWLRKAAM